MNKIQALTVARKMLQETANMTMIDYDEEQQFEKLHGYSHAQVINALPIIEAMETVEAASYA